MDVTILSPHLVVHKTCGSNIFLSQETCDSIIFDIPRLMELDGTEFDAINLIFCKKCGGVIKLSDLIVIKNEYLYACMSKKDKIKERNRLYVEYIDKLVMDKLLMDKLLMDKLLSHSVFDATKNCKI